MSSAAATPSLFCQNHPERAAIALCVLCRNPICGECTTRFQGINHCSRCVPTLAIAAGVVRPVSPLATALSAVAAYGSLAALLYVAACAVAN